MPQELDARYTHKGVYSAWLLKVKGDGARAKWIQSSCRRYFTIDFDSHIVFYSHSETDKRISLPTSFRDIMSASMAATPPQSRSDHGYHVAGQTFRRTPPASTSSWSRQAGTDVPFVLQTRDRRIRLAADTEAHALSWVEMLNAAQRLGQEERQKEAGLGGGAPKTENAEAEDTEDMPTITLRSKASAAALRRSTDSPTELGSTTTTNTESRSTTEGSESNEIGSPTAWSDVEAVTSGAASVAASPPPATETRELEADANAPLSCSAALPTRSLTPEPTPTVAFSRDVTQQRRATWQDAAEAAKVAEHSTSFGLQLQAADFGLDDSDCAHEGACSRESSPDSVTISPRLQQGLPNARLSESVTEKDEACLLHDDEDDDNSDCDIAPEAHDRRIELDLELVRPQKQRHGSTRVALSSPAGNLRHKENQGSSVTSTVASKPERVEEVNNEDKDRAARIAADLGLLRKPGGASSVALAAATVPAPLRQRSRTCAAGMGEGADEEKAKRRAARKAAKEAARQSTAQDLLMSIREHGVDVCTDDLDTDQMSPEEAKARRKAARRAAREQAAKQLEAQQRHVGETACIARDAWTTEAEVC